MRAYDPVAQTWALSFFLTDHLGSLLAVTDESGSLVSEQRYPSPPIRAGLPFGEAREDPSLRSGQA